MTFALGSIELLNFEIGGQGKRKRPLLAVVVLASTLVATSASGQSFPVSEGSLPQSGKLTTVTLPPKKAITSVTSTPARGLVSVDLTPKARILTERAVLNSEPKPKTPRRSVEKKAVAFPGPVSIKMSGVGSSSSVIEQDGRFLLVGASDSLSGPINEQRLFLARFEPNGTPDPTFGQGGSTEIILYAQNNIANNSPPRVALTPDGKIVVARTISALFPGNEPGARVAVVRLDHDGTLDPTFGAGGLVYTTIKNVFEAHSVAVQRDNKVVVGGVSGHSGLATVEPLVKLATLVRYQSDGQLDSSFGNAGVARNSFLVSGPLGAISRYSSFSSIVVQENGLIVAVGRIETTDASQNSASKILVAEYLPTGELNPGFGSGGAVIMTFDGTYQRFYGESVVIRENGRILLGGTASFKIGVADRAFVFAQLTMGGELDSSFGRGGKVLIDPNPNTGSASSRPLDRLNKILLAPSGDIYAVGITAALSVSKLDHAIDIVAMHSDGSLKQDFGKGGIYSSGTYIPWKLELADDALLTSRGRLVISGTHWNDDNLPKYSFPDGYVLWAYSVFR